MNAAIYRFVSNARTARKFRLPPLRLEHAIRTILYRVRNWQATKSCDAAMHDITVRRGIRSASRELSVARIQMMKAHNWLNDYLSRRLVPEDLKRRG